MQITVVAVGKLKEKYLNAGVDDFRKRLSRYCKFELVETGEEKVPEGLSAAEKKMIKDKEGAGILRHLKAGKYVIALDIQGEMLSSRDFAEFIRKLGLTGNSHIIFVIGGTLGLSEKVLRRANFRLSFSSMTFPHQMMRLILLEQLFRAFRIIKNEPYHR